MDKTLCGTHDDMGSPDESGFKIHNWMDSNQCNNTPNRVLSLEYSSSSPFEWYRNNSGSRKWGRNSFSSYQFEDSQESSTVFFNAVDNILCRGSTFIYIPSISSLFLRKRKHRSRDRISKTTTIKSLFSQSFSYHGSPFRSK